MKKLKIVGVTSGRKGSSSEILLKEALFALKDHGCDVSLINLRDYKINRCLGCNGCGRRLINGKVQCVQADKDDMSLLMDYLLDSDGIIISAPTYGLMPDGQMMMFMQRFLAYNGAFLEAMKETGAPRKRVGAVIAMGGARRTWQSLSLECLRAGIFTLSVTIVDQMLGNTANLPAQILMYDDQIQRAHKLGENVYYGLTHDIDELTWLGDPEDGWCPVCHTNSLCLGSEHFDGTRFKIECTTCGAGGDLERQPDGSYKFVVDPVNGMSKCRITKDGIVAHMHEIIGVSDAGRANADLINERKKKYSQLEVTKLTRE